MSQKSSVTQIANLVLQALTGDMIPGINKALQLPWALNYSSSPSQRHAKAPSLKEKSHRYRV
jgi:hypothetical protein